MTGRMDWRRARLHGRPTTDYRHEHDVPDRADKWLLAVENRRREQRPCAEGRQPEENGKWQRSVKKNRKDTL
jgi:hypothetical protein